MDDAEIRLRCLELAFKIDPLNRDQKVIAEVAAKLYDFCNAPQVPVTAPGTEDKPRRGRPPKAAQD